MRTDGRTDVRTCMCHPAIACMCSYMTGSVQWRITPWQKSLPAFRLILTVNFPEVFNKCAVLYQCPFRMKILYNSSFSNFATRTVVNCTWWRICWGSASQAGRLRVWFTLVSLTVFLHRRAIWPCVRISPEQKWMVGLSMGLILLVPELFF